jgi:hypothetical protein
MINLVIGKTKQFKNKIMKNKTQRIQNIKTGQLFERYLNYEKGFVYVHSHDGKYTSFKYYLSDLSLRDGDGAKFNPKEWKVVTLDISASIKRAKKLAKLLNCRLVKKGEETNPFAGYENGTNKIKIDIWGDITLVCTCGNCGDGSHVDLTNVKI